MTILTLPPRTSALVTTTQRIPPTGCSRACAEIPRNLRLTAADEGNMTSAIVRTGALVLAVVAFVIATYDYSFCILLENDCHALERAESCAALARTMRSCALLYGVGVAAAVVAFAAFMTKRKRAVSVEGVVRKERP